MINYSVATGFIENLKLFDSNFGKIAFIKLKNIEKKAIYGTNQFEDKIVYIECVKYKWGATPDESTINEGDYIEVVGKINIAKSSYYYKKNGVEVEAYVNKLQIEKISKVVLTEASASAATATATAATATPAHTAAPDASASFDEIMQNEYKKQGYVPF